MQKGGKQLLLVRCNKDSFFYKFFDGKYRSISIGRIRDLESWGCQFESGLLYKLVRSSKGSGYRAFYLMIRVRVPSGLQTLENIVAIKTIVAITVRWCSG